MSDYKYTRASLYAGAQKGSIPKSDYVDLFQHTLDEQFYNASNWWTIQEEIEIGSRTYRPVDVRISHVINAETGLKLGDDWKTLFFKSTEEPPMLGRIYLFNDNVWLTTNIETEKNLTATCTIRRCNNTLRWLGEETGHFYEEPCVIEYLVKEPRDYATQGSPFKTPGGFLHIEGQFNERTNLINENQRFLFGNPNHWTGYRVIGTGINDFRNTKTYEWRETKVLTIDVIADFVNEELDDVINGIANAGVNLYTLDITETTVNGAPGDMIDLHANVTYNGNSTTRTVIWNSSDTNIANVDSTGKVTFLSVGECTITANIEGNPTADTCSVIVSESPARNLEIKIYPPYNYVLEGRGTEFVATLYENGIPTNNTFTITCNSNGITDEYFTFICDETNTRSFVIVNKKLNIDSALTIDIQANEESISKTITIYLRGAWLVGDV